MESARQPSAAHIPTQSNEGRERLSSGNDSTVVSSTLRNSNSNATVSNPFGDGNARLSFSQKLAHALPELTQDKCACGRTKSTRYALCPLCSRFVGPTVIVESPSELLPDGSVAIGNVRYRECGLESANALVTRLDNVCVRE